MADIALHSGAAPSRDAGRGRATPPVRPEIHAEPKPASQFGLVERPLTPWEIAYGSAALRKAAILVVLALVWEIYGRVVGNPLLFPTFGETVAAYFRSEHWNRAIEVLSIESEPVYHAHVYIETQIHPMSLEEIVRGYFAKTGRPVHRKIEIFTSGQVADSGSIHGIEPRGMPHFDLLWKFSPDALIRPAARAETVEYWGKSYMDAFLARYLFTTEPTPEAEAEVEAYFAGPAWAKYCELNEHRDVVHIHANVETSLHPDLIRAAALKAMAARGWDIEQAVPVAFQMRGQMHGKIVFIGNTPEKIFDIAWAFNPTVALIPSTRYWLTTENPTYDARTMAELPLLLKRDPYRLLSLREIEANVEAI